MSEINQKVLCLLRFNQVKSRVGLSKSTTYQMIAAGLFPRPIKIGVNARAVGWVESEVNNWIEEQISRSKAAEVNS